VLSEAPSDIPAHAHWFGEDQARYVVTVPAAKADAVLARARDAAVLVTRLGVTGGEALSVTGERPVPVATLRDRFEAWFPAYMAGEI
jgi:phosphoribosylformylglycinamidine synthase